MHKELAWAQGLDVCARLHLGLGQREEAFGVSSQAMRLLASHPWLPTPQAHLHTHHLALRAQERVRLVAGNLTDDALRQSWLHDVRLNQEILARWSELGPDGRHTGPQAPAAAA